MPIVDLDSLFQDQQRLTFVAYHCQRSELVYLPTYSPHLNHTERLWRLMRS